MKSRRSRYLRHRFPPEIISHAVWLYYRFSLSFREVEDLLAERGVIVTYEAIRQWSIKFGAEYVRRLKGRQGPLGDTWYLDEVFVTVNGQRQYLWRTVDQDGEVIDILVQPRRYGRAARIFFRKSLKSQRKEPFRLVTDKLESYRVAHRITRELMPLISHDTSQYARQQSGREDSTPGGRPPFGLVEVEAMSHETSPSTHRPYGIARVTRVWRCRARRSTRNGTGAPGRRRWPSADPSRPSRMRS